MNNVDETEAEEKQNNDENDLTANVEEKVVLVINEESEEATKFNDQDDSAAIADENGKQEEIHVLEDFPAPEHSITADIIDDEVCPDEEYYK